MIAFVVFTEKSDSLIAVQLFFIFPLCCNLLTGLGIAHTDAIAVLKEQWNQTVGIREVPGGYYTGRHVTNAIRKCLNEKDDPRETILDYVILINDELTKKRKEFGLPLE